MSEILAFMFALPILLWHVINYLFFSGGWWWGESGWIDMFAFAFIVFGIPILAIIGLIGWGIVKLIDGFTDEKK